MNQPRLPSAPKDYRQEDQQQVRRSIAEMGRAIQADHQTVRTLATNAQTSAKNAETAAQNAQTAASNAQTAANNAQSSADSANAQLANIASDNLLKPVEKSAVIRDHNVITNEQAGIDAQADAYSITTEKASYDSSITSLNNYLATLTSPTLWSDLSGNTTIDGPTFRSAFATVYEDRQTLLNAIYAAAKAKADTAKSAADAAQGTASAAKGVTDAAFDPQHLLQTGTTDGATIAGTPALATQNVQHGVFLETFDRLPASWNFRAGTSLASAALSSGGEAGGHLLLTTGELWAAFPYNYAFDPSKLYRIRGRVKQDSGTTGTAYFYLGVEGVAADGVTLVNQTGVDSPSSQHYVGCSGVALTPGGGFVLFTGWFQGWGGTNAEFHAGTPSSLAAPSGDARYPSKLHPNVRYFRPMFILDYPSGSGYAYIDELAIDVMDEDGVLRTYTTLSGQGTLSGNATQTDSSGSRSLMRGYYAVRARNGDSLVFPGSGYSNTPKYRISQGIMNEPRSKWNSTGDGTTAPLVAPASTPQYPDMALLGLTAAGCTAVRARLHQKGSTATHSDTWGAGNSFTADETQIGATTSTKSPTAAATDDHYSVAASVSLSLTYDTEFPGTQQSVSVTVALMADPLGGGATTELATQTFTLTSPNGNKTASYTPMFSGTMTGGSASSTFWLKLKDASNGALAMSTTVTANTLQYNTSTGDQYASMTPDTDDSVLVEVWEADVAA